jgi:hypothetical protein
VKRFVAVAALAAMTIASAGTAVAKDGGNSDNAKKCQQDGWQTLIGDDGTIFANEEQCVSFGARGGTIVPLQAAPDAEDDNVTGIAGNIVIVNVRLNDYLGQPPATLSFPFPPLPPSTSSSDFVTIDEVNGLVWCLADDPGEFCEVIYRLENAAGSSIATVRITFVAP